MIFKIVIEVEGSQPSPEKLLIVKAAAEEVVLDVLCAEAEFVHTRIEKVG